MRFRFAAVLSLTLTASAFAVAPQFWRVRNVDDFLAGDIDGFAVTSRGDLRAGPTMRKIASFTDPFVLSQTTGANGDRFFGTGNDGKVYRLRGTDLKLLYTASEPEIYALAFHDGAVYAASSPNGKVYRIDPNADSGKGKAAVFFDPKQAYVWALAFAPNGDLLVATGVEGKLFQVTPKGEGKVLFTAPETHVRCLALEKDGTILAGGSGKGRIYEVHSDGTSHALYDSPLSEISTIYVDANGIGWAAGASGALPTTAPTTTTKAKASSSDQKKDESSTSSTATPEVSVTFETPADSSQAGNGEIYKINPDGFVETVRKFEHELVYAISGGSNGSILLSTGPQGRIYSMKDGEVSLIATVPEKQIVSISSEGGATLVTTTNSGAVYRMDPQPSQKAEFRSAPKDVERFSRFGHYRIEGDAVGDNHVAIAFRSGNTRTPDSTWSNWSMASSSVDGNVDVPPGRYIQWKMTMPKPSTDMAVHGVTVGYINRNVAPVIDAIAIADPAVVYISSAYPSSPQVVEATNPDENGIFTSLDSPREKNEPGKKVFRKGFRTITWRGHDDNGDSIRYSLAFRQSGSGKWLRLRDDLDENQFNFDTSQMPDGTYELRLVATDARDNPENPLTDTKEGVEFQVDNTPPQISFTTGGSDVVIHVTDKMSPIGRVEYSIDAQKWIRIQPIDGISDSPDETYKLPRNAVAGKFVIVRAVDGFYNVATEAITVQ
ncbi:MAG TPA: hypothetical protein VGR95_00405 [Thermoanaerobaculia bacterium]|jgi:hypothetical protein|nr:hypothetical protein [Thermoanaerobaculia bacterium]